MQLTTWKSPQEREEKLVTIAQQLIADPEGETYLYMGLTLRKQHMQPNGRRKVDVLCPEGRKLDSFDMDELRVSEMRKRLQEVRTEVTW